MAGFGGVDLIVSWIANLAFLGAFVCWIIILVKMFQNKHTVAGIISIVLCCVGPFIVLVDGWRFASVWRIKPLMTIYTILIAVFIVALAFSIPRVVEVYQQQQALMQQQMQKGGGMPAPAPAPAPAP